jgi:hypothetical protein
MKHGLDNFIRQYRIDNYDQLTYQRRHTQDYLLSTLFFDSRRDNYLLVKLFITILVIFTAKPRDKADVIERRFLKLQKRQPQPDPIQPTIHKRLIQGAKTFYINEQQLHLASLPMPGHRYNMRQQARKVKGSTLVYQAKVRERAAQS